VINLPKEIRNNIKYNIKQLREKIYHISTEGNKYYHDDKLEILNFCTTKMENVTDIPNKGAIYLWSYTPWEDLPIAISPEIMEIS